MIHEPPAPAVKVARTPAWLVALISAAVCIVLITGGWLLWTLQTTNQRLVDGRASSLQILNQIKAFTDPSSKISKATDAKTAAIIAEIIVCLENHEDRLAARFANVPAPPLAPGCPATTP